MLLAAGLQALAMVVDEGRFHARRPMPRWERLGHPLDTATVAACYAWLLVAPHTEGALGVYAALAVFSCVFVTKDERVHTRLCTGTEHWLHAVLFILHPVVLAGFALAWWTGHDFLVAAQLSLTMAFGTYQLVRWNFGRIA
ncbi:MAG TPA: hypothetical protein VGH28_29405 [Polyangiaceae bacterium]